MHITHLVYYRPTALYRKQVTSPNLNKSLKATFALPIAVNVKQKRQPEAITVCWQRLNTDCRFKQREHCVSITQPAGPEQHKAINY